MIDRLGLRLPAEEVEARLRAREPGAARSLVRASVVFAAAFTVLGAPLVWIDSGPRLALGVAGGLFLMVPIVALFARREAARATARWRGLPWDRGVSFVSPGGPMVLMAPDHFFLERRGLWEPAAIAGVAYQAERHALVITTRKYRTPGYAAVPVERPVPLPRDVPRGQAEALADCFHMIWTRQERQPSKAAKDWLRANP